VGLQWGDEGKGKVVDYHAGSYEAVVRYNGGSNAGHTVVVGKKTLTFHLLPSGVLKNSRLMIGPGVVVDPEVLSAELSALTKDRIKPDLLVDGRCTLVTPMEKQMDVLLETMRGSGAIGTTKQGIGPAFAMRALRLSPRAMDLTDGAFDPAAQLSFYGKLGVNVDRFGEWAAQAKRSLRGIVGNVGKEVACLNEAGKGVILEGAQGTLLDILHGSYPFVTATNTLTQFAFASLGLPPSNGRILGVMKAYCTRVGAGPFPSEIKGELGEEMRHVGQEYGATTGRPRRVGWLDLVSLKYAVDINGVKEIALTKLDVLTQLKEFAVCTAYKIDGRQVTDFYQALPRLDEAQPVYEHMVPLTGLNFEKGKLPKAAERFVEFVEDSLGVDVVLVSLGQERSQTIQR
jgi:adenylosuccinate synthase